MAERALLFTDIVDSTQIVERIGDERAAALWADHDSQARSLLVRCGGTEIGRGDGFFLIFDSVANAAVFALGYHELLGRLGIKGRCGLHVGSVLIRANSDDEIARGARPIEVEGLSTPIAARVMSLAGGGRTLMTAAAVEALGNALPDSAELRCHGSYRFKGIELPIEVFELGPRGTVPFDPPADTDKAWRVFRRRGVWLPARQARTMFLPNATPSWAAIPSCISCAPSSIPGHG